MPNLSKALTRVLLLALFAFQISLDSPNVFAKPSEAKKSPQSEHAQSPKYAEKQLPLLTMDQIASLEFSQAVKYVRAFRKSFVDIESAQFMFRNSKFTSAMLLPEPSTEDQKLFAMIIGKYAFAEDTEARGAFTADRCIYAYHISKYPLENGKRQPFQCVAPQPASCTSPSGAGGTRCNFELSGLSANDPRTCVPRSVSYKATKECDKIRGIFSKENKVSINNKLTDAKNYFKIEAGPNAAIDIKSLQSEEAKSHIADLFDTSYDDASYATLIKVLAVYKKAGITSVNYSTKEGDASDVKVDANSKDNFIKTTISKIDITKFENNMSAANEVVDSIFEKYTTHCSHALDQKEIDALNDPNWIKKINDQSTVPVIRQERKRIETLKNLQKAGGKPTIENTLEIDECSAVRGRLNGLKNQFSQVAGSLPAIAGNPNSDGSTKPANPPKNNQPIDIKPAKPDIELDAIGCSSNVAVEEEYIFDPSARCMVCQAERDMVASSADETDLDVKNYKANYNTSRKWHSLISTMAMACGHGDLDQSTLAFQKRLLFEMTFGHCETNTYDWNPYKTFTAEEKKNLREWSDNSHWKAKEGVSNSADNNDGFKKLYGISYSDASKLFCHVGVSKKFWIFGPTDGVDDEAAKNAAEDPKDFMQKARKHFADNLDTPIKSLFFKNEADDSLKNCMKESLANAEELYNEDSNYCVGVGKFSGQKRNGASPIDQMFTAITNGSDKSQGRPLRGAVIFNAGGCAISKQIETRAKDGAKAVAFVSTRSQKDSEPGDLDYVRISSFDKPFGSDGKTISDSAVTHIGYPNYRENINCRLNAATDEAKAACGPGSTPVNINKDMISHYGFTYPSKAMCPPRNTAAAKRTSPSSGSTK